MKILERFWTEEPRKVLENILDKIISKKFTVNMDKITPVLKMFLEDFLQWTKLLASRNSLSHLQVKPERSAKASSSLNSDWTLLTSPSYGSHTQYVLFMVAVLWVHSSLVWTVLDAQDICFNTADIVSSPLLLKMKMFLTTLQAFVSESHRETSQWRWTSS